jgi:hypothetical protein
VTGLTLILTVTEVEINKTNLLQFMEHDLDVLQCGTILETDKYNEAPIALTRSERIVSILHQDSKKNHFLS